MTRKIFRSILLVAGVVLAAGMVKGDEAAQTGGLLFIGADCSSGYRQLSDSTSLGVRAGGV